MKKLLLMSVLSISCIAYANDAQGIMPGGCVVTSVNTISADRINEISRIINVFPRTLEKYGLTKEGSIERAFKKSIKRLLNNSFEVEDVALIFGLSKFFHLNSRGQGMDFRAIHKKLSLLYNYETRVLLFEKLYDELLYNFIIYRDRQFPILEDKAISVFQDVYDVLKSNPAVAHDYANLLLQELINKREKEKNYARRERLILEITTIGALSLAVCLLYAMCKLEVFNP